MSPALIALPRRQTARLGDDLVDRAVEIEGPVDPRIVPVSDQGVDFQPVSFGIEKIARDSIPEDFVGVADAMIDGHAEHLKLFIVLFDVFR